MTENEEQLKTILHLFDEENLLKDVIVIGSWTQLLYKKVFENFTPLIRTTDVDFYIPNTKIIKTKGNIIDSFKKIRYRVHHDILTNKTKVMSVEGFQIEFLTKLNRLNLPTMELGSTGLFAESISYVDIFEQHYIEVEFDNLTIKVASPASYVLQKLLINSVRNNKSEKDIESIKYVLSFIKLSNKSKNELKELYLSLPKKWIKKINESLTTNNIDLFD